MLECCKKDPLDYQIVPYKPARSSACAKACKMQAAFTLIVLSSGSLALVCSGSDKVYDCVNLTTSSVFLLGTAIRPNLKLQDLKDIKVFSYEFLTLAMLVQAVMYSVVFSQTFDETDFNRGAMFGFSLSMTATAVILARIKHCKVPNAPAEPSDLEEKLFFDARSGFA